MRLNSLIEVLEHKEVPAPSGLDTSSVTKMAQVPSMLDQMLIDHGTDVDQRSLSMDSKKQGQSVLHDLEEMDPRTWSVQQTATWCKSIGSAAHTAVVEKGINGSKLIEMSRSETCTVLGLVLADAVLLQESLFKIAERHGLPAYFEE
ncbi:hypothetical protein HDU81_000190 [Chytriomyces hyalinus]|nr:hypothetical protein HDU81_000190 [Chytriomyces hyalinus]